MFGLAKLVTCSVAVAHVRLHHKKIHSSSNSKQKSSSVIDANEEACAIYSNCFRAKFDASEKVCVIYHNKSVSENKNTKIKLVSKKIL